MTDTATKVNAALLTQVLDKIEREPGSWNQHWYATRNRGPECGTAYCFAGHAVVLAGLEVDWERENSDEGFWLVDGRPIPDVARELLGITPHQAERLFAGGNDLDDLYEIVADLTGRDRRDES